MPAEAASAAASAPVAALLIGEQHDQPDHQRQAAQLIGELASQGRLQAVVLEMAERGATTRGLPPTASEPQVQAALRWDERGWPWARYRDIVMNAVRSGVPVLGGNLPRNELRQAQTDARWDTAIAATAWSRLRDAVRDGHCGLVPDEHLGPMVRMQVARDRSLAETVLQQTQLAPAGKIVVLHAGAVHAARRTGVPLHLAELAPRSAVRTTAFAPLAEPADFDEIRTSRIEPQADHCAALRESGMPAPQPQPQGERRPDAR